jgi:hypothetical protein
MAATHKTSKTRGERGSLEELFSIAEAARKLGGVSPWSVRTWLSQGRLERTKVGGRTMVGAGTIRAFLDECAEREADRLTKRRTMADAGQESAARG